MSSQEMRKIMESLKENNARDLIRDNGEHETKRFLKNTRYFADFKLKKENIDIYEEILHIFIPDKSWGFWEIYLEDIKQMEKDISNALDVTARFKNFELDSSRNGISLRFLL